MGTRKVYKQSKSTGIQREALRHNYINKYYNLWQNTFLWPDTITYQQRDYLMRKFWEVGAVAGWKDKLTGVQVFTIFAAATYNTYDWPITVNLINVRGVPFIPNTPQVVDKDVVIGYAQRNKKPIREVVEFYVDRIIAVEMVININLQVHKTPWLIPADPIFKQRIQEFMNKIENDEFVLFIEGGEENLFKALQSGSQFIIDKLYAYKKQLENELNEYLGIDNMGIAEKKEHLINAEVESNNDVIARCGECITDSIIDFFIRLKEFTGIDSIPFLNKPMPEYDDEQDDEGKDKEGEEDEI